MPKEQFLYTKVYSELKEKIENGNLPPGSKLQGEEELRKVYQVSIITIKRAMQMLAKENYVRRIPGRGTFVMDKEKWNTSKETDKKESEEKEKEPEKLIGVVMEYAMPSFGIDLMYELDKAAREKGYRMCLRFSYADREREIEEMEFLISLGIKGLIILPCHGFYYNTVLLKLVIEGFPVVVLDKKMEGIQVPSIRMDNEDAVFRLVNYLKEQGRSRIGIITVAEEGTISLTERRKAFHECIDQLHFPVMEECILPQTSYEILKRGPIEDYVIRIMDYLKRCGRQIDGVVCTEYGDLLAFAEAVQRMGPEMSHILACGVDEVYLVPGGLRFAHVKQNEWAMADKALEILFEQIEGKNEIQEEIKIPGIFRE